MGAGGNENSKNITMLRSSPAAHVSHKGECAYARHEDVDSDKHSRQSQVPEPSPSSLLLLASLSCPRVAKEGLTPSSGSPQALQGSLAADGSSSLKTSCTSWHHSYRAVCCWRLQWETCSRR